MASRVVVAASICTDLPLVAGFESMFVVWNGLALWDSWRREVGAGVNSAKLRSGEDSTAANVLWPIAGASMSSGDGTGDAFSLSSSGFKCGVFSMFGKGGCGLNSWFSSV